jgi:hypothetical protein
MTDAQINAELQEAKRQMNELMRDKVLLDLRIGQLSGTINTLTDMLQPKPDPAEISDIGGLLFGDSGITGAIRVVLTQAEAPLSPVQIRTELWKRGFDLHEYANAMAVIHNTLKRLEKQGELMTVTDANGQTIAYTTRFQSSPNAFRSLADLAGTPIDPEKLPEEIRAVVQPKVPADHPLHKLRAKPRHK